jgi:oligoribonuclease (3'-5' exoribonuclease)
MAGSGRPRKPVLPIMVDIETLSLDAGRAAVIDIAVVPIDGTSCGKSWLVRPSSYEGTDFGINQETVAFHANNKSGIVERAEAAGVSWQTVALELALYLQQKADNYEIHIWCQGKDFDIPVMNNFLKQAGQKPAYKYYNTHCLRDLSALFPEVRRDWFGNHTAMKDTRAQCHHIEKLCAHSDRIYNFVFGGKG